MKKLKADTFPPHILKAISNVVTARDNWAAVNGADTETKTEILSKTVFLEEESGKRIVSPKSDFLMSENDFDKYIKLVYVKNCEKGFDSGDVGNTFWAIQKGVYDAEDALIDAIGAEIPEHYTQDAIKTIKQSPELRKKFFGILGL